MTENEYNEETEKNANRMFAGANPFFDSEKDEALKKAIDKNGERVFEEFKKIIQALKEARDEELARLREESKKIGDAELPKPEKIDTSFARCGMEKEEKVDKCKGCKYAGEHIEQGFRPFGVCLRYKNLGEADMAYRAKECPFKKTNYEKIMAMSIDELSNLFVNLTTNMALKLNGEYVVREFEFIKQWLESEKS